MGMGLKELGRMIDEKLNAGCEKLIIEIGDITKDIGSELRTSAQSMSEEFRTDVSSVRQEISRSLNMSPEDRHLEPLGSSDGWKEGSDGVSVLSLSKSSVINLSKEDCRTIRVSERELLDKLEDLYDKKISINKISGCDDYVIKIFE